MWVGRDVEALLQILHCSGVPKDIILKQRQRKHEPRENGVFQGKWPSAYAWGDRLAYGLLIVADLLCCQIPAFIASAAGVLNECMPETNSTQKA